MRDSFSNDTHHSSLRHEAARLGGDLRRAGEEEAGRKGEDGALNELLAIELHKLGERRRADEGEGEGARRDQVLDALGVRMFPE